MALTKRADMRSCSLLVWVVAQRWALPVCVLRIWCIDVAVGQRPFGYESIGALYCRRIQDLRLRAGCHFTLSLTITFIEKSLIRKTPLLEALIEADNVASQGSRYYGLSWSLINLDFYRK